jgi:hypothetical protein
MLSNHFTPAQIKRLLTLQAEQADARYSSTIAARTGKTRWTLTADERRIPEIQEAYRAMVNADEAFWTFCRMVG